MEGFSRLNLIGSSPAFNQALQSLHRYATVDATVLICGESGTGKELAARALHYLGPRCDGPFIPINCGVLSDSLLESELFGHERGAFTDARRASSGLVGEAQGGTIFLDEIDTLTPRAQGAMLRFLQDKTYRRLGGQGMFRADVRVVVASNADLNAMVDAQQFRRDLLYRLNVLQVSLPPLRQREQDALLLAKAYVQRLAQQYQQPEKQLHPDALLRISKYSWPGNVRELENVLLRDFLLSEGMELHCRELQGLLEQRPDDALLDTDYKRAKAQALETFERRYIGELLARSGGNMSEAARLAGKERSAFGKLVRKYGFRSEQEEAALLL